MKQKTVLDLYPSLTNFIEKYCKDCKKDCDAPSIEMFCCILKKLNVKKEKSGNGERSARTV